MITAVESPSYPGLDEPSKAHLSVSTSSMKKANTEKHFSRQLAGPHIATFMTK